MSIGEETDASWLTDRLHEIDQFNETPGSGTTRPVYTKAFFRAEEYVRQVMLDLGLTVNTDCVGNLFGKYTGTEPDLPPVWTGSHIDTVPNGGRYDGLAGVFAGLAAVRSLRAQGKVPRRTISVNVYAGEEMSRFGKCCIGSRAISGQLDVTGLQSACDSNGMSIYTALEQAGMHPDRFSKQLPLSNPVHAHVELHIEQNDILEKKHIPVGIVTGICAPTNLVCIVKGEQGHAGGRSMKDRRDAYMAAAELALTLEKLTRESDSAYITATVGEVTLTPGAANVIPGQAEFTIDIRSISAEDKDRLVQAFREAAMEIGGKRHVDVSLRMLNNDWPYLCDDHIRTILHKEAGLQRIPVSDIVSGPYHDSLILSDLMPAGMLFIPCRNGVSHDRAEAIDIQDLVLGTRLLTASLWRLADE